MENTETEQPKYNPYGTINIGPPPIKLEDGDVKDKDGKVIGKVVDGFFSYL